MNEIEKIERQMKRTEKKFENAGLIKKARLMKTYKNLEKKKEKLGSN